MFKSILVPLDGSGYGKSVLPYVKELAPRFGSKVYVLGVGIGSKQRRVNRLLGEYINDVANNLRIDNIEVEPVILYGRPADEILIFTEENDIDLIIMATHRRGGMARWWVGSVAENVVSEACASVLLVRSNHLEEIETMKKSTLLNILAPLDGSDIGEAALSHAEALAMETGASLSLLQVIPPPGGLEAKIFGSEFRRLVKAMHDSGEEYLGSVAERLTKKGVKTTYKVIAGDPAHMIVEHINDEKVSLVAMSTHGRTGIARWILGSVADKVLHEAEVPMFLVRSPKMITARHKE